MGEKLLAQRALALLRDTTNEGSREALAALEWARDQRCWLRPDQDPADAGELSWNALPCLIGGIADEAAPDPLLGTVARIVQLLELDSFDGRLLEAAVALQRLPRLSSLRDRLACAGMNLLRFAAQLAGASAGDAEMRARRSECLSLGLLCIDRDLASAGELRLQWSFSELLDRPSADEGKLVDSLAGVRQGAELSIADFPNVAAEADLIVRLLRGTLASGSAGVNVLIYGPPGTGKTELARAATHAAGASLFAVGEMDSDGDELGRSERLQALNRAQRLLARRRDSVLLFDEAEDLFDDRSSSSRFDRCGSKIFMNRLLEQVAVPVIWTFNAIGAIDAAHLRRFSFVLRMPFPQAPMRLRIAARAAAGVEGGVKALEPILATELESGSVAAVALRTAAIAGGQGTDAVASAQSLLRAMRGGTIEAPGASGRVDLSLYPAEVGRLIECLTAEGAAADFSLLLSGPPGTGKTALTADMARRLGRPLAVKRASDLLSKWVGGTEANIAEAFAEARESGAILLFDEADSLLADRASAAHSWEVTQVNELLTWMDAHPLPFVAATNYRQRLDAAVFRRFVFKVDLEPLAGPMLASAFRKFFDAEAPDGLREVQGLTPGDFAVVARQLRFGGACSPAEIAALLEKEAAAKPGAPARLGF